MVLEKLGEAIKKGIDKLSSAIFVDKKLIDSIVKDLQRSLIEADVNIALVKELSDSLRKEAANENIKGVEKKEHIIKLLHDTLLNMLGGEKKELQLEKEKNKQNIIMLLGLYGSGKTTTINKLALYYSKRGFKVAMLGLDVHRPAATDQLEQLGKQSKLPVFVDKKEKDPIKIYKKFKDELKEYNLILVDTAGRHDLDKDLIKELKEIGKEIKPQNSFLVIPADIGQAVKKQTQEFKSALNITGVIVTRMDSSAKGGGALTACSETKTPVYFITTGERPWDIETFNPSSFISRILGMGDLESLIEKVNSVVDEKKQKKSMKRLQEGKFNMRDLYEQLKAMQGMGSLSKLTSLIPGLGKAKISDEMLEGQEGKIQKWKHIIGSMTPEEIENPEILEKQKTRINRIAAGSGTTNSDVKSLLKQYSMIKEFSKSGISEESFNPESGTLNLSQKQMQKLAKKFGKKMRM